MFNCLVSRLSLALLVLGAVAYAAEWNVLVVPEIEMPGHSLAVLAAYPGLSCTDEPLSLRPFLKGPNIEEVFCAGNEKVHEFLQDVLAEVITLFPSPFNHMGVKWMREAAD
jgi:hexosaminidase